MIKPNETLIEPKHAYVQNNQIGIIVINSDTYTILAINSQAAQMIGVGKNIVGARYEMLESKLKATKIIDNHAFDEHALINDFVEKENGIYLFDFSRRKVIRSLNDSVLVEYFVTQEETSQLKKQHDYVKFKKHMLSRISHRVRTPLNSILGFGSLLQDEEGLNDTYKEYIEIMTRSGTKLLSVIENAFFLTKITEEYKQMDVQPFDIYDLVHNRYLKYKKELNYTEKELEIKFHDNLREKKLLILSDRSKIVHIVEMLINNAIKHSYTGFIKLDLTVGLTEICISVEDTGIGISSLNLEYIRAGFSQAEMNSLSIEFGLGIGVDLAVCKLYADALGGKMTVYSEEVQGSVFQFSFPYTLVKNTH